VVRWHGRATTALYDLASLLLRVPATSANLGPGFDALGLAVDLHLELSDEGEPATETHPAVVAFRSAGGEGPLSVRGPVPPGRGLGFSGAARVGGLLAADVQAGRATDRHALLAAAARLEGHADNVAPSLLGGVVATASGRAVRVPVAVELRVVVWIPDHETSTDKSRVGLPDPVPRADAVHNLGHTALLVAALAAGDLDALRHAVDDRLHQDWRLAQLPDSAAALRCARERGARGAWLSGSGPSVAAFALPSEADELCACLPPTGRTLILALDQHGACVVSA
jgi:homoserine kinase